MEDNQNHNQTETPKPTASPNTLLVIAVIGILAVFGVFLVRMQSSRPTTDQAQTAENNQIPEPAVQGQSVETDQMEAPDQVITVEGGEFYYQPNEIRVKLGETVKIIFNDVEGFHDFVIDEFNVKTPQIQGPNTAEVIFTVDKAGVFEFYCSVGRHREMGMNGTLIVE